MTGTSLDAGWQVRPCLGEEWRWHITADKAWDAPGWLPARVPGSVLDDVWRAGLVPDPYVGRNSLAAEWVPERAWVYRRWIRAAGRAVLRFEGVDHSCTVCVDGREIASHEGMFVPFEVDVTDPLADGDDHLLAVVVHPAPESEPQVGTTSKVRAHKSRMGYGWDFCPRMVHQGIWRPVTLHGTSVKASVRTGREVVHVKVATAAATPVTVTVTDPRGRRVTAVEHVVEGEADLAVEVTEPDLWWPNGHGDQPLYRVDLTAAGEQRSWHVGFREVELTDDYQLVVNGERIFLAGWNWVPVDAMYGVPRPEKLAHLLRLAKDAGVNLLRVWGGGLIEGEEFYSRCSQLGLLVWQELSMSSSGMESRPAEDAEFVSMTEAEVREIVPTLQHHPSLVAWCGGNELESVEGSEPVLAAARDVVAELDPGRRWLPTSPFAGDVHGPWEHQGLLAHYRLYDAGTWQLHSEFGVEGMTNARTLERLVPQSQRWPADRTNPVYEHLGAWWNNAPLVQECFGNRLHDLDSLRRASQFLQADGLRYAVEANRRRASGTIPWQLNESYPNAWCTAAVDHRGDAKPAYHAVRRAYRPVHVCAAFDRLAWGGERCFHASVSAWGEDAGRVTARLVTTDGTVVVEHTGTGAIAADTDRLGDLWLLDLAVGQYGNRYVFSGAHDLAPLLDLPPARIDVTVDEREREWLLRLHHVGGAAALGITFADARPYDAPGWAVFDDNLVDLLPGESRTVLVDWRDADPSSARAVLVGGWNVEDRRVD